MKILFVAMHHSIHTVRWISQLADTGWEIHLFAPNEYELPHTSLRDISIYHMEKKYSVETHNTVNVKDLFYYQRDTRKYRWTHKYFPEIETKAYWLSKLIKKIKPDIIHSMEMQQNAYLTYEAKKHFAWRRFPPWIYSCWGSDIYYFQQFDDHRKRIIEVLKHCDYLFTDCNRDVELARKYGFKGKLLGVFPGVGGYKINEMRAGVHLVPPSKRKTIVIKGYTGWVYRPQTIIKALHKCKEHLNGYTLVFYGPTEETIEAAENLCSQCGAKLEIIRYASHDDMIKLFASARISLASSISDGTPNSMLEAMIMGAFPIQSDTVSTVEWIQNGINGHLAHPEDPKGFAMAIKAALKDDQLVNRAAEHNLKLLTEKIDYSLVQPQVITAYKRVYEKNKPLWKKLMHWE